MNALKHIIMMEDLIANPSNDASLFPLQRNLLSSKGLSFVPFKLFGVLFLLLTRGRMAKSPLCFMSVFILSVYSS